MEASIYLDALFCAVPHWLAVWLAMLQGTLAGLIAPPTWVWPVLLVLHAVVTVTTCMLSARWPRFHRLGTLASWLGGALLLAVMPKGAQPLACTMHFWSTVFVLALIASGWLYVFYLLHAIFRQWRESQMARCAETEVDQALGEDALALEREIMNYANKAVQPPVASLAEDLPYAPAGESDPVPAPMSCPSGTAQSQAETADWNGPVSATAVEDESHRQAQEDLRTGYTTSQDLKQLLPAAQRLWTSFAKSQGGLLALTSQNDTAVVPTLDEESEWRRL